ncbi:MAG: hypothetical protein K2R98_18845 [Gemmataceae bacterium]|nr:hypothetical protein [Gemmataceae bacterium]
MKPFVDTLIPADAQADLEYALRLETTRQCDPAFESRIGAQTEMIRQEVLAEQGVLKVAVELIREGPTRN